MKKRKNKDYTVPIIVVVGLFVLTLMLLVSITPISSYRYGDGKTPVSYAGRPHAFALDQKVKDRITIMSSSLKNPGYIVVVNTDNGTMDKTIGVSPLLRPGLYGNRQIKIANGPLPAGEQLLIEMYEDNGDGVFTDPRAHGASGDTSLGIMSITMTL